MLHRIPRSVRWALLVAVLGAITVSVLQSWTSGAPGTGGWQQTQWGPLGPADRDLLIKVRQAGLWEAPTGQQMSQQATNLQVRETGQHLAEQHAVLDQIDRDVADKLGVQLPSRPSDQQIAWMNQITNTTGTDYDRVAVQIVREAHGNVLPVIAEVRVSTRNEQVRQFADTAFQYVTGHIAMLEATGLVDYSALPAPPSPGLFSGATTPADMIVPAIVFLACIGAAIGLIVTLRRGKKKSSGPVAPATGSQLASLHAEPVLTIPAPRDPPRRKRASLPVGGSPTPPVAQTGGHRARRRGSRSGSDTGGFRRDDSGSFRWDQAPVDEMPDADTGALPVQERPRRARSADTGGHRAAGADSGAFPAAGRTATAVSDSGGYSAVSDTGRRRRVRSSDSGSMLGSASSASGSMVGSASSASGSMVGSASSASGSGSFRFDELLGDRRADTRSPQTPTRGLTR
jgi:predicted outer membrane protein